MQLTGCHNNWCHIRSSKFEREKKKWSRWERKSTVSRRWIWQLGKLSKGTFLGHVVACLQSPKKRWFYYLKKKKIISDCFFIIITTHFIWFLYISKILNSSFYKIVIIYINDNSKKYVEINRYQNISFQWTIWNRFEMIFITLHQITGKFILYKRYCVITLIKSCHSWFFFLRILHMPLGWVEFFNLFPLLAYFCYYSWVLLYFLILFMDPTILFSLFFNFFFYTFSKKVFNFN